MAGGWAHGPAEAWAFALHLSMNGDRDKRMAMPVMDNATTEIALRTYLGLQQKQRGGPKWEPSAKGGGFCAVLSDGEWTPASPEVAIDELLRLRHVLLYALT